MKFKAAIKSQISKVKVKYSVSKRQSTADLLINEAEQAGNSEFAEIKSEKSNSDE